MVVFVKQFGGYAMKDSVNLREARRFAEVLSNAGEEVDTATFYTAGYDSPMKFWNRRNEVMFTVELSSKAVEDAFNKEGKSVKDESLRSFDEDSFILSTIGQPYQGI